MENKKIKNPDLKRRILSISYKYKLSHIGSCLTAVDIIDKIYSIKKPDEKFVLSSGHAGLALYVILEKYFPHITAEDRFLQHGVHPNRDTVTQIDCSTGSLGLGLPIAVGMALADRAKNVYCLISDGECSEGSVWEALRIMQENKLSNLKIYANLNGWGAYKNIETWTLSHILQAYKVLVRPLDLRVSHDWENTNIIPIETNLKEWPDFLQGQQGHYKVLSKEEYEKIITI